MLDTVRVGSLIDKIRYRVEWHGHVWEVDEFLGDNAPLMIAEIELGSEGETFETPPFVGREVTGDHRFTNAYLAEHPFRAWGEEPA
ncbi:MAG: hypothetical protein D6760_12810 [Deltaproteobacteria bacterium]|nr:MAG: hypothetical protein D6760_12810 [Deltaproteobacteria bacterium]